MNVALFCPMSVPTTVEQRCVYAHRFLCTYTHTKWDWVRHKIREGMNFHRATSTQWGDS